MPATIEQSWVVGTAEACAVRVRDPFASLVHCRVDRLTDGRFVVTDLGSMNGTRIRHGDSVRGLTTQLTGGLAFTIKPGDTLIVGRGEIPWAHDSELR